MCILCKTNCPSPQRCPWWHILCENDKTVASFMGSGTKSSWQQSRLHLRFSPATGCLSQWPLLFLPQTGPECLCLFPANVSQICWHGNLGVGAGRQSASRTYNGRGRTLLTSHNAVCIWKVPPGSWPMPAEGYLPTAVIVCNYRANLFSSAGSGW